MDQGSKWTRSTLATAVYPLPELNKQQIARKKQMEGLKWDIKLKWANSPNEPRVKMGYCCLPPERVELAMNSKRNKWQIQNGSRVKMDQGSRSAIVLYPVKESN